MMRVFIALLLSLTVVTAAHAGAPTKLWELKGLDAPELVVFDPASNALYVSNIGGKIWQKDSNGFIAKVSPDGKMIERDWLTGLTRRPASRSMAASSMSPIPISSLKSTSRRSP